MRMGCLVPLPTFAVATKEELPYRQPPSIFYSGMIIAGLENEEFCASANSFEGKPIFKEVLDYEP